MKGNRPTMGQPRFGAGLTFVAVGATVMIIVAIVGQLMAKHGTDESQLRNQPLAENNPEQVVTQDAIRGMSGILINGAPLYSVDHIDGTVSMPSRKSNAGDTPTVVARNYEKEEKMLTCTVGSLLNPTDVEYIRDHGVSPAKHCVHNCRFCYARIQSKVHGWIKHDEEWVTPMLVSNAMELLEKKLAKKQGKIKKVFFSFWTDPFMEGYPEVGQSSMALIKRVNEAGIPCIVLTKGRLPIELLGLDPRNEYGITLVSLDEEYRKVWEPGAAPLADRLASLRDIKEAGGRTWVSAEPYPTPNIVEQDPDEFLEALGCADKIVFGRMNYVKTAGSGYPDNRRFYRDCAERVMAYCRRNGKSCHIKAGTMGRGEPYIAFDERQRPVVSIF